MPAPPRGGRPRELRGVSDSVLLACVRVLMMRTDGPDLGEAIAIVPTCVGLS